MSLILGLNAYAHSAAACLVDGQGQILAAVAKERLTRKKHDGGDVAETVEAVLEIAGAKLSDLSLVVANNHLFRLDAFEERLPWAQGQGQFSAAYLSELNRLPGIARAEIPHHLAHAWSVLPHLPFADGLICVMDGMGSLRLDCHRAGTGFHPETRLAEADPSVGGFLRVPEDSLLQDGRGWREGETAFFLKNGQLQRLFKRWIPERTSNLLHNVGFENMESLGAVYSRVSSHIFGTWNACGKVMGLAPWAQEWAKDRPPGALMRGPLESLQVGWQRLSTEPGNDAWGEEEWRSHHARLAADVQADLETITLDFLTRLRERTGAKNLALAGGVALNCANNAHLAREAGFEQVFVPPWPGDDGIAIGCANFGCALLQSESSTPFAASHLLPASPFLGRDVQDSTVEQECQEWVSWVEIEPAQPIQVAVSALAKGEVVGWFQGRAEFGPRALGSRCILADPRVPGIRDRINQKIKGREDFRPLAPVVLEDRAEAHFLPSAPSPFMSFTAQTRGEPLPETTHVDGSARLQTLPPDAHPLFGQLLAGFEKESGSPVLLNTSFNIAGEAIVETPADALRTFLDTDLDLLVMGKFSIRKKSFPEQDSCLLRHLAGAAEMVSNEEGDPLSVRITVAGKTHEVDALDLGLWEACDGSVSLGRILDSLEEEHGENRNSCKKRVQWLWEQRLLATVPPVSSE